MITIDELLLKIDQDILFLDNLKIPNRDKRIIKSLGKQLRSNHFLTENQGKLIIKIFKENFNELTAVFGEVFTIILNPTWTRPFRNLEKIKNIYLESKKNNVFFIEFTYDSRIKNKLNEVIAKNKIDVLSITGRVYQIVLTEKNIFNIVKELEPFKFKISEDILKLYKDIIDIKGKEEEYRISYNKDFIFPKLSKELGPDNIHSLIHLTDRQIKYGYVLDNPVKNESLISTIASRAQADIWINKAEENLNSLLEIIKDLNRFPILFVFDSRLNNNVLENLLLCYKDLSALEKKFNVYFRLDKKLGFEFNEFIATNKLNQMLTAETDAVIIDNSKLPKFFMKANWYPNCVISFTNSFRNNKLSVWCDQVDLIIYYTNQEPIIRKNYAIL